MRIKTSINLFLSLVFVIVSSTACNNKTKTESKNAEALQAQSIPALEKVLTAEEQKSLTADQVIQILKEGDDHFTHNHLTTKNYPAMLKKASSGQYPEAVILTCMDSRIPVEEVFDRGIGDVFVIRVAGNVIDEDVLGSMEYGCKVSGSKLIVVMGHQSCGAVKEAIHDVKMGNITELLSKIKPAIDNSHDFNGEKTSENHDYVDYVVKKNILNSIAIIRQKSPILKEMEDKGEIRIVGAYYSLETGEVVFL